MTKVQQRPTFWTAVVCAKKHGCRSTGLALKPAAVAGPGQAEHEQASALLGAQY